MILHVIRHGKTIANERKLYCGATDLPLSEAGVRELLILKEQIDYPLAQLYVVSGLLRAVQTANILFDYPTFCTVPQLQEIHFGAFEMRGYDDLRLDQAYQNWIANIEQHAPPGGESKETFTGRVMDGICEIEGRCQLEAIDRLMIVTHGGVIATLMEYYFPRQKNFYEWQPACGRGYTLDLGESKCYNSI